MLHHIEMIRKTEFDTLDVDTGDKSDASFAWYCHFDGGYQGHDHKSAEGAAVVVRLIPLTA